MVLKTTLAALPDVEDLRKLTQALAMLDAIMSPGWEYRYYSFNSKWDEREMMASTSNGSGDGYLLTADIEQIAYPKPIGSNNEISND